MEGFTQSLPLDVIIHILFQLPVYDSGEDGVQCLLNCQQVSRIWREAACLSSLWKAHYESQYRHCDETAEAKRRSEALDDWRIMYGKRRRLDQQALCLLDRITNERKGRYAQVKLLFDMSYDVWDVLERSMSEFVDTFYEHVGDPKYQTITRRYWAQSILQVIGRGYAVKLWSSYTHLDASPPSFDQAMTLLSCFFGKSPFRIAAQLDDLANECKQYLLAQGSTFDTSDTKYDLQALCVGICRFMSSEGFGPVERMSFKHCITFLSHSQLSNLSAGNFSKVLNQFPHAYLSTSKSTIPISLVHVFVAIARRMGISASPLDFPGRVLVHITHTDPNVDDIFLDVFQLDSPIISARAEIPSRLMQLGISGLEAIKYISPVGGAKMILRAARNILSASRDRSNSSYATANCALQASICIHLLLTTETQLISNLLSNVEILPLDCATYLPSVLAPALPVVSEDLIRRVCDMAMKGEAEGAIVRRRAADMKVKYFVGALFVHVRHGYSACVVDWDVTCSAPEDWILQMDVDALSRGRNQPFYHCVADDGSQRYVAEENIELESLTREVIQLLLERVPPLAVKFGAAELHTGDRYGRARLLMSPEGRYLYPDDDLIGKRWVETGKLPC